MSSKFRVRKIVEKVIEIEADSEEDAVQKVECDNDSSINWTISTTTYQSREVTEDDK